MLSRKFHAATATGTVLSQAACGGSYSGSETVRGSMLLSVTTRSINRSVQSQHHMIYSATSFRVML